MKREGIANVSMMFWPAARSSIPLWFAVAFLGAGCRGSGGDAKTHARDVSYDGGPVSTVQAALDQLNARLAKLEQGLDDLNNRMEALEAAQGPAPAGPVDAADVRWRDAEGTGRDVASTLSDLVSQFAELAEAVGSANSLLADLKDSVSTLQHYHECPPGATRVSSVTPGLCVDQHASSVLPRYREAAANCMERGGRLCTHAEFEAFFLFHTDFSSEVPPPGFIAAPQDIPDDNPDLGSVEWMADTDNVKPPGSNLYSLSGLYWSWDNRGTHNPAFDGTFDPGLPYRCCYDR